MSTDSQPAASTLAGGTQLGGGRYELKKQTGATAFGVLFEATDTETGNPVSIQFLENALLGQGSGFDEVQRSVSRASEIEHKNVARVLDVAQEGQHAYVVSEFLDGQPLSELLAKRQAKGSTFSPKQVSNITAHLCSAVEACSKVGGHGAVTLDSVRVNKAGRVKLTGLGLGILAPAAAPNLGASLAPETSAGNAPNPKSDVYGVGAVVYELLTGAKPEKGCKRPSEAVPGLSPLVDQFIGAVTNPDQSKRPGVEQVAPAATKALSTPSTAQAAQPRVSREVAAQRPSLAQSITMPVSEVESAAAATPRPRASAQHEALSRALADDHERYLVNKGKLDYGPFTLAVIVEQIETNQITPGDTVVDNETGTRTAVEDHPLLEEIVERAKQKRDDERRANAEVVHAKQERSRGAILYVFIALAVVGLGGGAYKIIKALSADESDDKVVLKEEDVGKIEPKITFVSDDTARKRVKKRRGKKGNSGGGNDGVAGGWDDSLDLGDASEGGGGGERLSNSQVNSVIQSNGRKLVRCLTGSTERSAFIEFMVKGSTGKVYQVRVNGSTGTPLAKCMRKAMMSMNFPKFDGIRSKHNFDMSF